MKTTHETTHVRVFVIVDSAESVCIDHDEATAACIVDVHEQQCIEQQCSLVSHQRHRRGLTIARPPALHALHRSCACKVISQMSATTLRAAQVPHTRVSAAALRRRTKNNSTDKAGRPQRVRHLLAKQLTEEKCQRRMRQCCIRQIMASWTLSKLSYSQHELPCDTHARSLVHRAQ